MKKKRRQAMSAYSQAASGFVVSDRVTLMLNTLSPEARKRILARAYDMFFRLDDVPLTEPREEQAAKVVEVAATEIATAFRRRQKQSREARQVGAALREIEEKASHDNRETSKEERKEEKGSPTPPIKEESKEENISTPKPPRFVPPTIDEVKAYCEERKNGIDPQSFMDFYTSKGWKIGSNSMKDWRAAVRNWERMRRYDGWRATGYSTNFSMQAGSRRAGTPTAGNFRSGTEDQRAEAEAVL